MYGVNGELVYAIRSFYQNSKAYVHVGKEKGKWFFMKVGLL